MSLQKELAIAIAAGQTSIAVQTDEQPDALLTIGTVCRKFGWDLRVWDRTFGLRYENDRNRAAPKTAELTTPTLTSALRAFLQEKSKEDAHGQPQPVVTVVRNFEVAGDRIDELFSVLQHLSDDGKAALKFVILLVTPGIKLPGLLAPLFFTIEHELPDEAELADILDSICKTTDEKAPAIPEDKQRAIVKAALGLNRLQAEGAFATSLQRYGEVRPDTVWKYKVHQINDEGLVEIYEGTERFDQVGGLTGAKDFLVQLLDADEFDRDDPAVRARGVTMLGAPGVGKSLLAKCLGNETGRPIAVVDIGKLMGSLVGDTEARTRKLFQILRRLAPVICLLDEFGKQMPSTTNKANDSGVSARLAGAFLAQMQDVKEDIFYCFCENDISHVDRGFTRAERIDAIIYVKLPGPTQRAACWRIYFQKFFPPVIGTKKYPHYIELGVDKILAEYANLKKPDPGVWGTKLAPALMCLAPDERHHARVRIEEQDPSLAEAATAAMVNDKDWTPAEICACVRLMRRLKKTLKATQYVVGHVATGDATRIQKIEDWCCDNGALDAETGKLFQLTREDALKTEDKKKAARRRVIENADPDAN